MGEKASASIVQCWGWNYKKTDSTYPRITRSVSRSRKRGNAMSKKAIPPRGIWETEGLFCLYGQVLRNGVEVSNSCRQHGICV